MSAAYSSRLRRTNSSRSAAILDLPDLVVEHRVDRRLRAHHRDRGCGERDAAVRLECRAGHRVEAGPIRLADDHRELRHRCLGDGGDHLGPVPDDPLALDLGADHEPRDVGEEEQREVERVAAPDETCRLVGRVDEQHPALDLGLVGDDPDRATVEARESDDHLLRPAVVNLEEGAAVDKRPRSARRRRTGRSRPPGRSRRAGVRVAGAAGGAEGGASRQLCGM